ncbi:MAG: hydantoinase/oxoprolinase family protein, partial [Chloroflexi bacterium]|nr:hydantoinase/oxoprolinase family protein [Chloroflexota bacterium]
MAAEKDGKGYLIALDAGGTMTDTFLVNEKGEWCLGKYLTDHSNEATSYMGSVADACNHWGVTTSKVHKEAISCAYTGTTMLNTLLTRTGKKVGLLITKGFEHMPIMERCLTWLGQTYENVLHQQLHEHTPWIVLPEHIKPIRERIHGGSYYMQHHLFPGTVIVPLVEEDVVKGVNELIDAGIEVIGILTIFSHTNPVHEMKAAEIARRIVKERGVDVKVEVSHEICPVSNESERLKSLLIQCYVTDVGRQHLLKVEEAAKKDGYRHQLLTLLSYGAASSIRYPKLYEAVISGPVGGMLGAREVAVMVKRQNLVCADLGGTTWDVGVIVNMHLPVRKEPDFAGHKLRLPMVAIDSISAGTGSVVHVDEVTKRVTLGPESAGSDVGTCYRYPDITIGDLDVILGYLSPDNFLGGKIKLNKAKALEAVTQHLAKPLGQDVYDVSEKVIDMMHSHMVDHVNAMLLSRGLNPAEFTLACYGGSGPLHAWGVERGLKLAETLVFPWGAAFSAFGVAAAKYFHRYDKAVTFILATGMPDEIKMYQAMALNQAWAELEERAYQEMEQDGISRDKVTFQYGISARYLGQMSSWEAPVGKGRVESVADLDKVIGSFEKVYTS